MGGDWHSSLGSGQTGWAGRNWGSPRDFTPVISSWSTPAAARQQLVASVNWPAGDDFSQAQKLPDMPQVAEFRWDRYPYNGGQYSSAAQIYERKIRARRDTAQSWEQRHTLLRLVLPVTTDYQREFSVGTITSFEKTDLVIPANQKVSGPLELRIPANDSLWSTGQGNLHRRHYFTELHRIPDAVPVNSGFDEGIIDSATGYAKPDSSDSNLKADREMSWRGIKAGDLITAGLHQGWFGIRPDAFKVDQNVFPGEPVPGSFYDGASIKIRKLFRTDTDTGAPESGHVRFWITLGDGDSAGAWSIDPYDRANSSYPGTELVGWVYGPNATVPAPSARVRYWIEGLTPGKCTLEFKCVRGSQTITHEQTFLVSTRKTKAQWMDEVHHQIMLQTYVKTGKGVDLTQYHPGNGFRNTDSGSPPENDNILRVQAIYYYYRQLFQQKPEVFMWAGMAKVAAAPIYAGMSDLTTWWQAQQAGFGGADGGVGTEFLVDGLLLGGQQAIFNDMIWGHRAYQASGIWALDWLRLQTLSNPPTDFAAWSALDAAIRNNNQVSINNANRDLLEREQRDVIQSYYSNFATTNYMKQPPLQRWAGSVPVTENASGLVNVGDWLSANSNKNPIPGGPRACRHWL